MLLHLESLIADVELSICFFIFHIRKNLLFYLILFVQNPSHPVLEMVFIHRIESGFLLEVHVDCSAFDVFALTKIERMVSIFEPVS